MSTSEAAVINTLGGLILRRDEVGHGQVGGRLCSAQKSLIRDALNKHRLIGAVWAAEMILGNVENKSLHCFHLMVLCVILGLIYKYYIGRNLIYCS